MSVVRAQTCLLAGAWVYVGCCGYREVFARRLFKDKNVEQTQIWLICGIFGIRLILPNVDASL